MAAAALPAQGVQAHAVAQPRVVRMRLAKQPGDRSFGMTLEQRVGLSVQDYLVVVSSVFVNSPAARVGIQKGWMLLRMNNRSVRGMLVKDVALMFRDQMEIDVEMEVRAYSNRTRATPASTNLNVINVVSAAGFQASFAQRNPDTLVPVSPPAHLSNSLSADQVQLSSVPSSIVANEPTTATTPGRTVLSPGSSLGADAAIPAARVVRTVAAPAMPSLNGPQETTLDSIQRQQETHAAAQVQEENGVSDALQAPATSTAATAVQTAPATTSSSAPSAVSSVSNAVPRSPQQSTSTPTENREIESSISGGNRTPEPKTPLETVAQSVTPATAVAPTKEPVPASAEAVLPVQQSAAAPSQAEVIPSPQAQPVVPSSPRPLRTPTAANSSTNPPPVTTTPTSGKKRARPRGLSASSSSSDDAKATAQRPKVKPRHRNTIADDSDDSDTAPSPSPPQLDPDPRQCPEPEPTTNRRQSRRRGSGGSTGRARTSLTVERLIAMGFKREDANASVTACGHNPDACMVWIVSHLEEKQFLNDLNQASIQSELSKREEEKELKKQEKETMKKAKEFTALFSTSYMLSPDSSATKLKEMLSDAIGDVNPDSFLRMVLTKLLKLEAQAIRWYKSASKCYLLQLAERLEASFGGHDVLACCSKVDAKDVAPRSSSCAFIKTLQDEERSLSKALFDMPENHGGVPLAFLKADKDMQFSLDDDGFEVVELDLTEDE